MSKERTVVIEVRRLPQRPKRPTNPAGKSFGNPIDQIRSQMHKGSSLLCAMYVFVIREGNKHMYKAC